VNKSLVYLHYVIDYCTHRSEGYNTVTASKQRYCIKSLLREKNKG
jgi:hypothetical protein